MATIKEAAASEHLETGPDGSETTTSLAATGEQIQVNEAVSKRIVRKYDLWILPLFVLINLFSFIDRVNIGNARLLGLSTDLELDRGLRWNIALMCLFVSYCVVELPSNIICKKVGGHVWIPSLVVSFGLITTFTCLVQSRGGLYTVRFLLGCTEGGISPGLVWMLSQLSYRRKELGIRIAVYISAASASGAFGGLLAIGLSKIPQWGLVHTWKNIFLVEGMISIVIGIIAFRLIPQDATKAKFLSEEEKTVAVKRLRIDSAGTDEFGRTRAKHVWQALTSVPVLASGAGFFFGNTVGQAYGVFSPSIIKQLGYSSSRAQLLSVGPYVVAAMYSIFIGFLSDRFQKRAILIIASIPISILGFALLQALPEENVSGRYGALYLAATGVFASAPLWLTWAVNNCATPTVRAAAAGIVFTMGSLGGVCAPWVYLGNTPATYKRGHIVQLIFACCSWACAVLLQAYCRWENRQRELGKRDHRVEGLTREQELELSSYHPAFRYMS